MENILEVTDNGKIDSVSPSGNKYLLSVEEAVKRNLNVNCLYLNGAKYRRQELYLINEEIYKLTKRDTYGHIQWIELKKLNTTQISKIKIDKNEISEDNQFVIDIILKKRGVVNA